MPLRLARRQSSRGGGAAGDVEAVLQPVRPCLRQTPPVYLPTAAVAQSDVTFMECAKHCWLEGITGYCDWFTYSPHEFQKCLMFKESSYWDFDEYSTTAEMVSKRGGDPMSVFVDTYLGQPISLAATLAARWRRTLATDAQTLRSRTAVWRDTNPEFAPQTGRTLRSKHLRRMNASAFAPMVRIRCCFFSGTYPSPPRVGPTRHLRPPCHSRPAGASHRI